MVSEILGAILSILPILLELMSTRASNISDTVK